MSWNGVHVLSMIWSLKWGKHGGVFCTRNGEWKSREERETLYQSYVVKLWIRLLGKRGLEMYSWLYEVFCDYYNSLCHVESESIKVIICKSTVFEFIILMLWKFLFLLLSLLDNKGENYTECGEHRENFSY